MEKELSKKNRQEKIIHEVNIHTRLNFEYLSEKLNVSHDTIRRDISELIKNNQPIVLVKGGVMNSGYHNLPKSIQEKDIFHFIQKQKIAQKLIQLLHNDMVLLIGGGTTISEFIKLIPQKLKLTIFTVNVHSAMELMNKPNINTIVIGGKLSTFSQMTIGASVMNELKNIQANLCIIGANALDLNFGLSDSDWDTVEIKRAMIQAAKQLVVLSISDKINSKMRYKITDCKALSYLVTECLPNDKKFTNFKKQFPKIKIL